jgi:hypothetical protein
MNEDTAASDGRYGEAAGVYSSVFVVEGGGLFSVVSELLLSSVFFSPTGAFFPP